MAEWTIAAVLKTAGLTAPGVRIPLPPLVCRLVVNSWHCEAQTQGGKAALPFYFASVSRLPEEKTLAEHPERKLDEAMKYCSGLLRGCVFVGAREHYSIQGYRASGGVFGL